MTPRRWADKAYGELNDKHDLNYCAFVDVVERVVAEAMAWEREDCLNDMVKAVRARARASRTGGK